MRGWAIIIFGLAILLGWFSFTLIRSFDPEVRKRMVLFLREHPFSPLDFLMGFMLATSIFMVLYIWETKRFNREVRRGDGDGGGTARLPLSRKVIPIEEVRRLWKERHGGNNDTPSQAVQPRVGPP